MAHRKGRSLLTGAGIVLGVAILFGVLVSNATTQKGVDNLIEGITGRADVVAGAVGSFDGKLPVGSVEKLRALPDVVDVVPSLSFSTVLPGFRDEDDPEEVRQLRVSGIVPDEVEKIRDFEFVEGRMPQPGRNEIVIPNTLSAETKVGVGDRIEVQGRKVTRPLVVVGIVDAEASGGFFDEGDGTFTSIETARTLQGEPPTAVEVASVVLRPGTDIDGWIDDHRDEVKTIRLQNAETLAEGFKQFLQVFGTFLTFFAAITLFVGAFLIYLTLSMAVIERTRMYGTLRALGATSKQVRRVVLTEAVALGFVSTIIGIGLGLILALGLLQLIGKLFELDIPGLVVTPAALITAVVTGMLVTTISALVPARRAGRLAPIEAMKGDYARDTKLTRAWIAGVVLLVFSVALQLVSTSALTSITVIGILLGAVLMVPLLLRPLASLLGRVTNRMARGVGDVAVLHLTKERSRSAYTLALVMVVMAMLFATGGLYLSVRAGIGEIIDRQFGADLFARPRVPDDGTLERKLAAQPGIAGVSPLRFGFGTVLDKDGKREETFFRTIEPNSYFAVSSYFWKKGNDGDAKAALVGGGSVLVSEEVGTRLGLGVGDKLTLETTEGNVPLEIAATYISAAGPPEITIGLRDAKRYLSAGIPQGYVMAVKDSTSADAVAKDLQTSLASYNLQTQSAQEAKEEARGQIATYFQIIYAILLIAAIVGLLGLANTLAMSVLHRFREIGILRAIGVTRSQAWRMVLVESSTMGLTAFILSMPLGMLLSYLVIRQTSAGFGFTIPTLYPWVWIPGVALFAVFIAVVAAIAPGRRAARLHVVTALQYE